MNFTKDNIEENISQSMKDIITFAYNFPSDWIEQAFDNEPNYLKRHLRDKFNGLCDNKENTAFAFIELLSLLDNKNKRVLIDYIKKHSLITRIKKNLEKFNKPLSTDKIQLHNFLELYSDSIKLTDIPENNNLSQLEKDIKKDDIKIPYENLHIHTLREIHQFLENLIYFESVKSS
jgi:hypothetical protein